MQEQRLLTSCQGLSQSCRQCYLCGLLFATDHWLWPLLPLPYLLAARACAEQPRTTECRSFPAGMVCLLCSGRPLPIVLYLWLPAGRQHIQPRACACAFGEVEMHGVRSFLFQVLSCVLGAITGLVCYGNETPLGVVQVSSVFFVCLREVRATLIMLCGLLSCCVGPKMAG